MFRAGELAAKQQKTNSFLDGSSRVWIGGFTLLKISQNKDILTKISWSDISGLIRWTFFSLLSPDSPSPFSRLRKMVCSEVRGHNWEWCHITFNLLCFCLCTQASPCTLWEVGKWWKMSCIRLHLSLWRNISITPLTSTPSAPLLRTSNLTSAPVQNSEKACWEFFFPLC